MTAETDLTPRCALGTVSFERRWIVRAPAAPGAPFHVIGDGIAIAIDVAHAAELHVQLGHALLAETLSRSRLVGQ